MNRQFPTATDLFPSWFGASRRAVGIVRVSSHKQGDGNSPDVQRAGIEAYAASLGLDLTGIEIIEESAKSSSSRKKFHEAMARAKRKRVRHLVFWVWDRIARNYTDVEKLEEQVRDDLFVLHVANERRVLHSASTDSEWLTADVNTLTSKHYSRELRRRAIESMAEKARAGWFPMKAPLGYRNAKARTAAGGVKDRGGTIETVPEQKRLVRRMAALRVQGLSLERIAAQVIEEGLVPRSHERGFKGPGAVSRVESILKNPFYRGEFLWRGDVYEGRHEPFFTQREWDELQETFGKIPAHTKRTRHSALGGWLTCADCGCRITYDPKKKASGIVYHYYRCANGRHAHEKLVYASEDQILGTFESALDSIAIPETLARDIADYLGKSQKDSRVESRREAARLEREIAALEAKEDALYDDFRAGFMDEVTYKRRLERLRADKRRAEETLAYTRNGSNPDELITARRILELASRAKSLWNSRNAHEKRELLEKLLSNPQWDGATMRYDLKKPFAVLAEMRGNDEWRARRDSNPQPTA